MAQTDQSNLDLISEAYEILTIIDEFTPPTAEQVEKGMTVLNDMLSDMDENGIRLGWYPQTNAADTAPLNDYDVGPVKILLASKLALRYGIDIKTEHPSLVDEVDAANMTLSKRSIEYIDADMTGLPFSQGGLFGPGRV